MRPLIQILARGYISRCLVHSLARGCINGFVVASLLLGACRGGNSSTGTNANTFSLTGSVTPAAAGSGAIISLTGPVVSSITASSSGTYEFTGLGSGSYVVTPSKSGYTFSPASQAIKINSTDVAGINFVGSEQTHSVRLQWNASVSNVAGYNVYRAMTSGGSYQKVNSELITGLSFTDSSVANGATYYYVCTSIDFSGLESIYSNQVIAVVP